MYRHIFIVIAACFFFQRQAYSQRFPMDTAKLKNAYNELMANPKSPKQQMIFFKLFPSTWLEYNMTYIYSGESMWYIGAKHSTAFENLYGSIPDSLYFDKLISIAINPAATKIMDVRFEYAWKEYDFQDIHPHLDHNIGNIR
jgi:hypothetical protein